MKKTTTWALNGRLSLARITGRIMIIEAPVVPTTEASAAPMTSSSALVSGLPWMLPATSMPPAMVNSANSRMMNDMYSSRIVWSAASSVTGKPKANAIGTSASAAQAAANLP